jgi:hypothetical protein
MIIEIIFGTLLLANTGLSLLALSAVANNASAVRADISAAVNILGDTVRFQARVSRKQADEQFRRLKEALQIPATSGEQAVADFAAIDARTFR